MFYAQDGNALYRYFKRNEYMKIELFQYLLDYYKVDMAYELVEDEKKILTFEFFKPTFEYGKLRDGATEIMIKPINNAQFCIYLNSVFMDKTIEIDGNGKVVYSESKGLLMDLDSSDIEFKDSVFLVSSADKENNKTTGITLILALLFIEWLNSSQNIKYSLPHFHLPYHDKSRHDCIYGSVFNDYPITKEFYYTSATHENDEGFRISPSNTIPHFFASAPSKIYGDSSSTASFRMMKLPIDK